MATTGEYVEPRFVPEEELRNIVARPLADLKRLFESQPLLLHLKDRRYNCNLLEIAVEEGREDVMDLLIRQHNADPHRPSNVQNAPLTMFAIKGGHKELYLRLVREHGMDVNPRSTACSAVAIAALGGQIDLLRYLVQECNANPLGMGSRLLTTHFALTGGKEQTWRAIVEEYHVAMPPVGAFDRLQLGLSAARGGLADVLRELVQEYGIADGWGAREWDAVALDGAEYGHVDVLRMLRDDYQLDLKIVPVSEDNGSLLHAAAETGQRDVILFLVDECGLDCLVEDSRRQTALYRAVLKSHFESAKLLLQRMVKAYESNKEVAANGQVDEDTSRKTDSNSTQDIPCKRLMEFIQGCGGSGGNIWVAAAESANSNMMQLLVTFLGSHDVIRNSMSIITSSVNTGNITMVKKVLQYCRVPEASAALRSGLYFACGLGYTQIATMLVDHGASLSAIFAGASPLHAAVSAGQVEMVRFLIERGASVDVLSEPVGAEAPQVEQMEAVERCVPPRVTPLQLALRVGACTEIVDLLVQEHRRKYSLPYIWQALLCRAVPGSLLQVLPTEILWEIRRWVGVLGWQAPARMLMSHTR